MNLNPIEVTSSAVITATPLDIAAVILVGGSANSSIELSDSADGNSNVYISLKALASDARTFTPDGRVSFTKVYAKLAGTAAKAYIYLA